MDEVQKQRADALQARLKALGVVDVKFFKGENWNETPMDKRLDEVEELVRAAEDHSLCIPVRAEPKEPTNDN